MKTLIKSALIVGAFAFAAMSDYTVKIEKVEAQACDTVTGKDC